MNSVPQVGWSLDPQLAADTVPIGDLPLSRVLLNADANFPWLILVPRRAGLTELIDLDATGRDMAMAEIAAAATALRAETGCDKLNIAAIGNIVAQLHIHIVARFRNDAAWPQPVWGKLPRKPYPPGECERLAAALRTKIPLA